MSIRVKYLLSREGVQQYGGLLFYAFFLFLYVFFDSKIPWNDGLGFDGLAYSRYSQCLPDCWRSIDSYHLNRLLMPFSVSIIFNFLSIQPSAGNVLFFYCLIDYVALVSCYYLCARILAESGGRKYEFLLFTGFISYPLLKGVGFYPVLSDYVSAYFFTAVYYYAARCNFWALFVVSVFGYFSHALVLPLSIVLFSFYAEKTWSVTNKQLAWLKLLAIGLICLSIINFVVNNLFHSSPDYKGVVDFRLVVLTVILSAIFICILLVRFFDHLGGSCTGGRCSMAALNIPVFIQLFCTFVLLSYFKSFFPSTYIPGSQVNWFMSHLLYNSAEKPLAFLAANLLFFGPLYVILVVSYMLRRQQDLLTPFRAQVLFAFLLLSMRPESRTVMFMWPLVVVFFVQSYGQSVFKIRLLVMLVFGSAVILSQALMPTALVSRISNELVSVLYFNIQGGYESITAWSVGISFFVALALIVCIAMRKELAFKGIPRFVCGAIISYGVAIVLLIYACSYSPYAATFRSVLSLTERDLLFDTDASLVTYKNMGDLERDSTQKWMWGFGPGSSIHFVSYSKQKLTLYLEVSTPIQGQVLSTSINNAAAVHAELDGMKSSSAGTPEKIILQYDFIPRPGINSIDFSYTQYNGRDEEMTPGDDRKFAVQFSRIDIKSEVPESYFYTFPYYFFMYGKDWPFLWYSTSRWVKNGK